MPNLAQVHTLTDEQIDAVYDHFENGVNMPAALSDIALKATFTKTMGRYYNGTRLRSY